MVVTTISDPSFGLRRNLQAVVVSGISKSRAYNALYCLRMTWMRSTARETDHRGLVRGQTDTLYSLR